VAHSVSAMVEPVPPCRLLWVWPGGTSTIRAADFGLALREMRQRAGISQRELAERIGTTQSAVARMEKGGMQPKVDTLEKLVEALDQDLLVYVRAVG
jgi:UDP-N-acetylglucosamine 1-carboxyvinyltransferase